MKKIILTSALVALALPANAQVPAYLSIGAGITHTSDSEWDLGADTGEIGIDNALSLSAAVGTSFYDNTRTELEVSYRNADLSDVSVDGVGAASLDGELKTTVALVNLYYDFNQGGKVRPYVSGGVGVAHHSGEITAVGGLGFTGADASDTVFAYQVGAGASFGLSEKTALWGGVRYLGSSSPDFDGLEAEYDAAEARAGLRFNF